MISKKAWIFRAFCFLGYFEKLCSKVKASSLSFKFIATLPIPVSSSEVQRSLEQRSAQQN
jgi:hypothetical protein